MLAHWINIYNLGYHIVVLKKNSVTLLKIALLGPYLGKNWASMSHAQNEAQFLLEITKGDHKLSRTFCFKNIISFDWVMNDFLIFCVILCCQNQPFPTEKDALCYLLLIKLLSLKVEVCYIILHSAFQSYSFSHCTLCSSPLSKSYGFLVSELQARWKTNKRTGWKKFNIHNNQTTFADCLSIN